MTPEAVATLCAALLLGCSGLAAAARTDAYKQSSKSALDFIAHEQAAGAAEAASPPRTTTSTPAPPRLATPARPGGGQQGRLGVQQPLDVSADSAAPKRDWELVPPRQPTPTTLRPATTPPPARRPGVPTYAGVVKDHHRQDRPGDASASIPRVHIIPIAVEDRANYTTRLPSTTTESSHWYDKFWKDQDDRRRRRRRQTEPAGPSGAQREEVVIGSNAIRVSKPAPTRPPARAPAGSQQPQQTRPRPSAQ